MLLNSVFPEGAVHLEVLRRQLQPLLMRLVKGRIVEFLHLLTDSIFVLQQVPQEDAHHGKLLIPDSQMLLDEVLEQLFLVRLKAKYSL